MTSQKRMLITGLLSALIYGLWTYSINFGADNVLLSALTQAMYSFIGGYVVAGLVEFSYKVVPAPFKFMVSAFVPYALLMILYAFIHQSIGTKHVFYTILPNMIIGFPYFLMYVKKLEKSNTTVEAVQQG